MATLLGTPAVRQILSRLSKSEKEENALVEKVRYSYLTNQKEYI